VYKCKWEIEVGLHPLQQEKKHDFWDSRQTERAYKDPISFIFSLKERVVESQIHRFQENPREKCSNHTYDFGAHPQSFTVPYVENVLAS